VGAVRCTPFVLVWQLLPLTSAPAQRQPSHTIRWWEAVVAVGAIGAVSVFDRRVDDWVQDRRSSRSDDMARVFRTGGEPELVFGVAGGILTAGVFSGYKDLQRSGGRVLASVVTAGLTTAAIKAIAGRLRPAQAGDQYVFKPFSHHDAFPSGHATMAFALATSLAEEIHRPWATALLYAGASGTAWSRLNDHKHWLSDVLAGATVGITAAKVIEGRWRIFGLGPPRFLVDPAGYRLEWRKVL
jgi:membrane-associated phospholipid phosphatase